ncbi:MAG: GNAT family N-acetyltransferase [Lysobacterales bacterium]
MSTTLDVAPTGHAASAVTIIDYTPELAPLFKQINIEWIEDMFVVEAGDLQTLDHPQAQIIDRGGRIWFASHPVHGIVGTLALIKRDANNFELTKMGVLKQARGLKVGEILLAHALAQSRQMNLDTLFLLTNRRCAAAIHLYEKLGFVHDAEIMARYGAMYARCDVAMRYSGAQR